MPARIIRDRLGPALWSSYFKFCIVRDPFEKLISAFYFRKARKKISTDSSEPDAKQFEHWLLAAKLPHDKNKYLIDGQLCLDYIVRYESLAADLAYVCAQLNLPWNPSRLPAFKAGIRPPEATVEKLYTETSKEIVRKAYDFELRTFGYSMDSLRNAAR